MVQQRVQIKMQSLIVPMIIYFDASNWETLTQSRKISRIHALFKAYTGERAWKAIGDGLKRPFYLSRVDHDRKISSRKQKGDSRKYSVVNRTIQLQNQLPADVLGALSCKPSNFKKRVGEVINKVKWGVGGSSKRRQSEVK
jgi:hypothetical protein